MPGLGAWATPVASVTQGVSASVQDVRADPVVGFEIAPGQQMHADFTTIRPGRDQLLEFVAPRGFGRARSFVRFARSEHFVDWREALVAAFDYSVACRVSAA